MRHGENTTRDVLITRHIWKETELWSLTEFPRMFIMMQVVKFNIKVYELWLAVDLDLDEVEI